MSANAPSAAEVQALDDFLNFAPTEFNGMLITSCFVAAVNDARRASGLRADGTRFDEELAGSWAGAVAWLCIFDQVGQTLKRSDRPDPPSNDSVGGRFKRALDHFTGLGTDDQDVLWLLRNSLAHSFNLQASKRDNKTGASRPLFKFVLADDDALPFINGNGKNGQQVFVNLRKLSDVGHRAVETILRKHAVRGLRLLPKIKELRDQYFMATGPAIQQMYLNSASVAVTGSAPSGGFVPLSSISASASPPTK